MLFYGIHLSFFLSYLMITIKDDTAQSKDSKIIIIRAIKVSERVENVTTGNNA